ncbi:MAG: peptide chain release factor N(5)-glutamine methyltransferase [Myxococcales bacterium]|nr:peptide chain release factor N(5)-glutamine methyltransferase [Myxococcales bacterium]
MSGWTIRQVVQWSAEDFASRGIESARLDAELLVSEALSLDRVRLYMDLDRPLDEAERAAIRELVKRRRAREPVAYILGRREFWGRRFAVGPAVLVPRPDTETLIERALELLPADGKGRVLDLCTGSGAIGVTLAAERPSLRVECTDVSAEALAIARANAERLGVELSFREGDLFAAADGRYRLVVCNPPYVAADELPTLEPEVRDHEPALALVSGPTGFEIHDRLVAEAGAFLEDGGAILVEVGEGQAQELARRFAAQPWVAATRIHEDLGRVERVVEASRRPRGAVAERGLGEGEEPGERE